MRIPAPRDFTVSRFGDRILSDKKSAKTILRKESRTSSTDRPKSSFLISYWFRWRLALVTPMLAAIGVSPLLCQTTTINIDGPASGKTYSGVQVFGGWAVDNASKIAYIVLEMDGVVISTAPYGGARQDVCNVYVNYPGCPNVGWSFGFDTSQLTNGWHWLRAVVTTVDGRETLGDSTFYTSNPSSSLVDIDAPTQGSTYSGTQTFGGWVIDKSQPITAVKVFIDGVWFGNAGIGGYRPDACNGNGGGAGCPYVGWSFGFDTRTLANGQHALTAVGVTADGRATKATASGFSVNNAIGIALNLDAPQSMNWYWGAHVLGGWGVDSSSPLQSASVAIDGIPIGAASPGARQDVCNVYKNYPGCPNVGWSFYFDTAQLPDGAHQICVTNNFANGTRVSEITPFVIQNMPSADIERATSVGPGGCNQASENLSSVAMIRNPGADGLIHVTYTLDNQSFATAVASAVDMWNQMSPTTGVRLELAPPGSKADLPIQVDTSPGQKATQGCAAYDPTRVVLLYGAGWQTSFTPAAIMAHELGHFMGLDDAGSYPVPPTIMNNAAVPGVCSMQPSQTTTVLAGDASSSTTCHGVEHSYMKGLQMAQAVFDAQRNTSQYQAIVYPPYPAVPPYNQALFCTYTYSTVNFYVDGVYDSSEQFVDNVSCSQYP